MDTEILKKSSKANALVKFLKQPSTYKGLFIICGLFGINMTMEDISNLANFAGGAYALIQIFIAKD